MARIKTTTTKGTLADAVSAAVSQLTDLGEQCREIVDNASEGLSQTQRVQTLDETAGTLEGFSEPDVPETLGKIEMTWPVWANARKGRGLSRADQCGEACAILDAVIDFLDEWLEKSEAEKADEELDLRGEANELRDELDTIKGDAEGLEFPGMYG